MAFLRSSLSSPILIFNILFFFDLFKSAYDCMSTLLDKCLNRIEMNEFFSVLVKGISDPSHEIKVLCYHMIQKLTILSPSVVLEKLEEMIEPLKAMISSIPKVNAVKQEVEKNQDLVKGAVRTVSILNRLLQSGGSRGLIRTAGGSGVILNQSSEGIMEVGKVETSMELTGSSSPREGFDSFEAFAKDILGETSLVRDIYLALKSEEMMTFTTTKAWSSSNLN